MPALRLMEPRDAGDAAGEDVRGAAGPTPAAIAGCTASEGPAGRPRRGEKGQDGDGAAGGKSAAPEPEAGACEEPEEESDGREKRRKVPLGHARAAVLHHAKGLTRDGAYWCLFCKHVFWAGAGVEDWEKGAPSFCCLCGSKLLPGARDAGLTSGLSYSQLAQMPDAEILGIMRAQKQQVGDWDAVIKFSHPGRALPDVRAEAAARSASFAGAAGKGRSKSRFCDICGHGGTHIQCSRCPVSFHKTCIILPADYPVPEEGWLCSCCMHEAIRVGEIAPLPLEPRVSKVSASLSARRLRGRVRVQRPALTLVRALQRTLPSEAVHCSSCGYPEIESLNCDACCRWFCYGCMCVSHECVPPGEWSCPECIGQKAYDALLSVRIKASRERWLAGKMTTKERNGFSQLVFDLLCSCAWCCRDPLTLASARSAELSKAQVHARTSRARGAHRRMTPWGCGQERVGGQRESAHRRQQAAHGARPVVPAYHVALPQVP